MIEILWRQIQTEISKLKPNNILDADQVDEVIHFDVYCEISAVNDRFSGKPIVNEDHYIRIKSLWYADLTSGKAEELVPYEQFDIQDIHIAHHYLYFIKIVDEDQDGVLAEDYGHAEIWRVHKTNKRVEFCFDCKDKYTHFAFETANDDVVAFRIEDEKTQLFFKQKMHGISYWS